LLKSSSLQQPKASFLLSNSRLSLNPERCRRVAVEGSWLVPSSPGLRPRASNSCKHKYHAEKAMRLCAGWWPGMGIFLVGAFFVDANRMVESPHVIRRFTKTIVIPIRGTGHYIIGAAGQTCVPRCIIKASASSSCLLEPVKPVLPIALSNNPMTFSSGTSPAVLLSRREMMDFTHEYT
jgi:hypothetical protein